MSEELDIPSLSQPSPPTKNSSVIRQFMYNCLFIGVFMSVLYILALLNVIVSDKIDILLSLYPRNFSHLWAVFTCTFVHDDINHLNSYALLFVITSICVVCLRGWPLFSVFSVICIVTGNLLGWCIGSHRMNGVSGWSFGLLVYIYISAAIDLGLPAKCTSQSIQSFVVAGIVTVLYSVLYSLGMIATPTATWQYNLSGVIGCIVAIYILHIPRVSRFVGMPERTPVTTPTEEEDSQEHRVLVGKKLTKFSDLRNPLVCCV